MIFDFAIIGSGFGGSVSALRLAEKGYSVVVLEKGKWVTPQDMEDASKSLGKLLWNPALGMRGFFTQIFFRHVALVGGVGVGGGSIVYAAVTLKPKDAFYKDHSWSRLGIDWKKELKPHYNTALKMLGVVTNPSLDVMDDYLKEVAVRMGAGGTFGPTKNGIYFGKPEVLADDPFFKGEGPSRSGCYLCGECLTGCKHGSKNTLDKNYLYLAQKYGATILPYREVTNIIPRPDGTYLLKVKDNSGMFRKGSDITAKKVVLAAGVLGTLELLFRCKKVTKTLPGISDQLGVVVRTNSESVVGVLPKQEDIDLSHGTCISSDFYPDEFTHITQNRFPEGYNFMKGFSVPLVDDPHPVRRSLRTIGRMIIDPAGMFRSLFAKNWNKRVIVLTVMQNHDNQLSFTYGPSAVFSFLRRRLKSRRVPGKEAPVNIHVANKACATLADVAHGMPINVSNESLMNMSTTAHILGGCPMGSSPANGVIDTSHRVFGCEGLYVADGSAVSANVGVNPSLTITALAERAMSLIPEKKKAPDGFLNNKFKIPKKNILISVLKKTAVCVAALLVLNGAITGISILQKGGEYRGQTAEQILGVPAEKATVSHIERLSKPEVFALFYASPAPEFKSMNGVYKGKTLDVGIMALSSKIFTNNFFGPGHWEGKAFFPAQPDAGWGHNLFAFRGADGKGKLAQARKMNTYMGASTIDGRNSFHLDYGPYNDGLVHSMHDELRKVNDNLYIGMGHMTLSGGAINPIPFLLYRQTGK